MHLRSFVSAVLLAMGSLLAWGQSDNDRITVSFSDVPLSEAISAVESGSRYTFLYDASGLDLSVKVSLTADNIPVQEALDRMLSPVSVGYEINGRQIALYPLNSGGGNGYRVITGKVLDIDNEPVVGAAVFTNLATHGVTTDLDGKFSIQVADVSKAVLIISYIGYDTEEIALNGKTSIRVTLNESSEMLDEVQIVAYGVQKKETLTGAISSVDTEELLVSPNASVANSLAGKITGLSSVQSSGQPGAEDPKIFVRGVGSLTEGGASPLILVDGVERSFFQMDPNEIENISVLKDASATAVFGVRGANGVILVTTRRGEEGKTKISLSSSVGIQQVANWVDLADAYTYATMYNEREINDGGEPVFDQYALDRFRLHDQPIVYPDIDWYDYMVKDAAVQTQHNLNISGGTDRMRYFISVGYLYQDGLMKDFGQGYGYKYNRYNYRTNLDYEISKSTTLKLGIGGVVGDRREPNSSRFWENLSISQPFASPGLVNGQAMTSASRFQNVMYVNPFTDIYGKGGKNILNNTMNLDLHLVQKLDMITKGLSVEAKAAYNTGYTYTKTRTGNIETWTPYFESEVDGSGLLPGDPGFNENVVYRISGTNKFVSFGLKEQYDTQPIHVDVNIVNNDILDLDAFLEDEFEAHGHHELHQSEDRCDRLPVFDTKIDDDQAQDRLYGEHEQVDGLPRDLERPRIAVIVPSNPDGGRDDQGCADVGYRPPGPVVLHHQEDACDDERNDHHQQYVVHEHLSVPFREGI